jgi:WD40 domain-containing protein
MILLNRDNDYQVSLGGDVSKESDYLRAIEKYGDHELKTKAGKTGENTYLQIIQADKILHEIEQDSTSGYRHLSYTFSQDGRSVISGSGNGNLTLYNRDTGKQVRSFVGHTGDVWAVAVAPDNRTLVSGSDDQTVRLWDIDTGRNLLTIFVGSDQEWVAWTPQGYYTSSPKGDSYIGWHLNQGEDKAAKYYSAAQFQQQFYRPDVVASYLQARDIQLAVSRANDKRGGTVRGQPVVTAADVPTFLPPLVYVIAPEKAESTVQQEIVLVKAAALSQTLPITDVKVFHNGIQIAGGTQGKIRG